jgi:LuxR family transcriptional regulator, maltose regulon positive regulatory protein
MSVRPSGRPLLGPAHSSAGPQQVHPAHDGPSAAVAAGPVLLRTKVCPPPVRPGLIPRPRLDTLIDGGATTRLTLINAPAGSGKTTLLARWCHAERERRKVAWLSLEETDDDPVRFWAYVIEALRMVGAASGQAPLALLQGSGSADVLAPFALPQLLNELTEVDADVALVLDDLHAITNPLCTQTLAFFIDHLPPNVHVMIASRVDPPLPLARLRASGDLVEIRIAELEFTSAEATALLNDSMGLGLAVPDVRRLWEGTEGWAAGLYLAGLSLRGQEDQAQLITSLETGHRHVVDYLGTEVLARQPERLRTFMLHTSILDRLTARLCDAVLETDDSATVLTELEHSNQFLIPLDDNRRWYRFHHLFAQLLRLELADSDRAVIPVLHQRAARWYREAGDIENAIHHAIAGGELATAQELIAKHWLSFLRRGRMATVERWLQELSEEAVLSHPPLALIAAWVGGQRGLSLEAIERLLDAAESSNYSGPMPAGIWSIPFAVAMARAAYAFGDVGRSVAAAQRVLEVADPPPSEAYAMGFTLLSLNLYLSGQSGEVRRALQEFAADAPSADQQPFVVVNLLALQSLLAFDEDDSFADVLARQAMDVAEAQGIRYDPLSGFAYIALARTRAHRGSLAEAEQLLTEALTVVGIPSFAVQHAQVLLDLAVVRHARGDGPGAQDAMERAHATISSCADPGMLPALLADTTRTLGRPARKPPSPEVALTERELIVLRMLGTALTQQEIARELYVSVNTVRSQIQGIYRKTGAISRQEAVTRGHELGLIASSSRQLRSTSGSQDG